MSNEIAVKVCDHCGDYEIPAEIKELETMRKQVAEMHAMMTQVSLVLRQMESHPMLSAFMPRLG